MSILRKLFFPRKKKQELCPEEGEESAVDEEKPKGLTVNREDALRRFAQREDLYEQALHTIAADYSDVITRLRKLIGDKNTEELRFVVHTLRGVMGSVGMEEIFTACSQLEELIDSDRIEESSALLEKLDTLMQYFFTYVNEHTKVKEEEFVQVSCEELVAVLEEIAPVVRSRRPRECRDVVSRLKNLQSCQPVFAKEAGIDQLIACIEGYEFDRAVELITLLRKQNK